MIVVVVVADIAAIVVVADIAVADIVVVIVVVVADIAVAVGFRAASNSDLWRAVGNMCLL